MDPQNQATISDVSTSLAIGLAFWHLYLLFSFHVSMRRNTPGSIRSPQVRLLHALSLSSVIESIGIVSSFYVPRQYCAAATFASTWGILSSEALCFLYVLEFVNIFYRMPLYSRVKVGVCFVGLSGVLALMAPVLGLANWTPEKGRCWFSTDPSSGFVVSVTFYSGLLVMTSGITFTMLHLLIKIRRSSTERWASRATASLRGFIASNLAPPFIFNILLLVEEIMIRSGDFPPNIGLRLSVEVTQVARHAALAILFMTDISYRRLKQKLCKHHAVFPYYLIGTSARGTPRIATPIARFPKVSRSKGFGREPQPNVPSPANAIESSVHPRAESRHSRSNTLAPRPIQDDAWSGGNRTPVSEPRVGHGEARLSFATLHQLRWIENSLKHGEDEVELQCFNGA